MATQESYKSKGPGSTSVSNKSDRIAANPKPVGKTNEWSNIGDTPEKATTVSESKG